MTSSTYPKLRPALAHRVTGLSAVVAPIVTLWLFVMLQADLKVTVSPYIHWGISVLLLPIFILSGLHVKRRVNLLALALLLLVPLGMLVNFVVLPGDSYDFLQTFKVILIFSSFIVLYACAHASRLFTRAYVASLVANLLLIGAGVAGYSTVAGVMTSDGRWGTFMNYPGSLTKVGIVLLVYGLYGFLRVNGRRWGHLLISAGALTVVAFDGSRTAALTVPFAIAFIGAVLMNEAGSLRSRRARKASHGLALTVVTVIAVLITSGWVEGVRIYQSVFAVIQGGLSERGLGSADASRFQMFLDGWNAVQRHPFLGAGMGSTTSPTPVGPMTVHNTYLQLWGDGGFFAFVALGALFLVGMGAATVVTFRVASKMPVSRRPFVYSQAFLLFYFPFSALFHPFSTEWSEWVIFLSAYATTLYSLSNRRELTRDSHARE